MPDELESQLTAFGRTLAVETGEAIEREPQGAVAGAAGRSGRRRWAVLGAAACVLAAVVGIGLASGDRASAPIGPAPTVRSTDIDGGTRQVVPAPDTPIDALHLAEAGWALTRYSRSEFGVIDAMSCGEMREVTALSDHGVVRESYRGPGDLAFMEVTHVRYPDRATALQRLTPFTDLRDCEQEDLTGYEQLALDAGPDIVASGYRQRGSAMVSFVSEDGTAITARVGNDDSDTTIQLLTERSMALLHGELEPLPPEQTATALDDLAVLVGPNPFGPPSEDLVTVTYELAPYETQMWPVCGPSDPVPEVGGAPSLMVITAGPGGEGGVVQFVRVDDPELRARLGSAFVVESDCPPSSQPDFGADITVDLDPAVGRWSRSSGQIVRSLIAPPGDDALPLVAIVTARPEVADDVSDRIAAFLVGAAEPQSPDTIPDDPLGLTPEGWTIAEQKVEPRIVRDDFPDCTSGPLELPDELVRGLPARRDQPLPTEGDGWDNHVTFVPISDPAVLTRVAEAEFRILECIGEVYGTGLQELPLDLGRAAWVRVSDHVAYATVAGDSDMIVLIEIRRIGAPFGDEIMLDLMDRAARFVATNGADSAADR